MKPRNREVREQESSFVAGWPQPLDWAAGLPGEAWQQMKADLVMGSAEASSWAAFSCVLLT
jgi:hypothetical protein